MITVIEPQLVKNARQLAAKAHAGQTYGEEFPYFVHLQAAAFVLMRFGEPDPEIIAATYLHDILEDTPTEYEDLVTFFGERVADIVAAVTKPKGMSRKQCHPIYYPRIRQSPDAIKVKLADRISHLEAGGKKRDMYVKEHNEFKRALLRPDANAMTTLLWQHLDSLIIG